MALENRANLECTTCEHVNYFEHKNSKIKGRLIKKKFCKHCGHHQEHKQTK